MKGICLLIGGLLACGLAFAAPDEELLLEVTVNSRPTLQVGQFTRRDGVLMARYEELRSLGIDLSGKHGDLVALDSFAQSVELNKAAQSLLLVVPARYLKNTSIYATPPPAVALQPAEVRPGAVFNYDLLANHNDGRSALSGYFDLRMFAGSGVLNLTGLGYAGVTSARSVRLDTTYTWSDPESVRRVRAGDLVSGGLGWSRPLRLGGLQVATDFNLRPDLVLFPLPQLAGEAVVPSTVDLFVNGIRQLSQPVPPGPFEIRQMPVVAGAGLVAIAVTDALGRQTIQTIPFYTTARLLAAGLVSYSAEAGWIRERYGIRSADYGKPAASGTFRKGLTPTLTVEAHGEATRELQLAGGGIAASLSGLGILSAAAALSDSPAGHGSQVSLGFERTSPTLSYTLSKSIASSGFRDIGALQGTPVLRDSLLASLGLHLGSAGSFNLAYSATRSASPSGFVDPALPSGFALQPSSKTVSLSYFRSILNSANMFVTGFRNLQDGVSGLTLGIVLPLERNDVASFTASDNAGIRTVSARHIRPVVKPGDIGWQLDATAGDYRQALGQLDYKGVHGSGYAALSSSGDRLSSRLGARGALAVMDGGVYASNWIDDSFALVRAPGVPHAMVYSENRPAGRTDAKGELFLPELRAYQANRISLDVLDLPLTLKLAICDHPPKM